MAGYQRYRAITAVAPVASVRLKQVPDIDVSRRLLERPSQSKAPGMFPGGDTHRSGVHNNGGGGRGMVVYLVDHKEPKIQCRVKRSAQDVWGR